MYAQFQHFVSYGINYPKNHFYKVQPTEEFDYVFVASGHYSVPYVPSYPGVDRFPGRVMHSHDFRDACEFAGKRLLIVSNNFLHLHHYFNRKFCMSFYSFICHTSFFDHVKSYRLSED